MSRRRLGPSRRLGAQFALAGCVLSATIGAGTARAEQRRVLTLHAARREAPSPIIVDQTLQRVLGQQLQGNLDYYSEYLDAQRFTDPDFNRALRDFLRRKYSDRRFDVVIATSDAALELVKAEGDELFADVPVVFHATPHVEAGPRSTGVTTTLDLARTLTLVTKLQPQAKRVFVVSGSSAWDRYFENLAREQFRAFERRFAFTYWAGLPMRELLERVAGLPPDSIVYYLVITQDGSGQLLLPLDSFDQVARAASAPIYTFITLARDRGVVGGSLYSPELVATRVAHLVLRVLAGEKPEDIPVVEIQPYVDEVDWRQLRRWGISEGRVPPGTAILFREPGLWERYRSYIIATLGLLLLQSGLIGGLLLQRARRRRVENDLRESEVALRTSNRQTQDLAGRLISAQEAERSRIARELHDDAIQQITGLAIVLSGLRQRMGQASPGSPVGETLAALQARTAALADGLRNLSHELHPGVLQHAGLAAALKEHCSEFARHHQLDVSLSADDDTGTLDPDIALCLYRVTQEALTNTARHARARTAHVRLALVRGGVELDVVDDGVGFDTGRHDGSGLGLRSIGERVRLARGSVRIESQPGHGTKVLVRIPIADGGSGDHVSPD